jgi:voltage-gated sodium channel
MTDASRLTSTRVRLGEWIEHPRQQWFIIGVILVNAATLGLETVPQVHQSLGGVLHVLDQVVLGIFVMEIVLKLLAHDRRFFHSAWNNFDFLIVAIALVPAASSLSILRTLRVFRLLRLLNKVPRLRMIVEAMLQAIPSIGWVTLMLLLLFYIFAVIGTTLFGEAFPEWFGGLGATAYTLFQVMTLESWSMGIARPVMEKYPYAVVFFVPFILIATFTMLNLFIAIIVSTMQSLAMAERSGTEAQAAPVAGSEHRDLLEAMRQLQNRIAGLEMALQSAETRAAVAEPAMVAAESGSGV